MEAYLYAFIYAKLPKSKRKKFRKYRKGFRDVVKKYVIGELRLSIKTSDKGWKKIEASGDFRNKLVHHKTDKEVFNHLTVKNAERAISSCRSLIRRLHKAEGTQYPPWVDKKKSEDYDTKKTKVSGKT